MKSLLIISKKQFGYLTDPYELSKHLKNDYDISFLCFDTNYEKYDKRGINVIYVSSNGNFITRGFRFIKAAIEEVKKGYNCNLVYYFAFCSLVKLFTLKKIVLDFRTGSVSSKLVTRFIENNLSRVELRCFNKVIVISEGLRNLLWVSKRNSKIIPLGANKISTKLKNFEAPKLFYIGTLNHRRIEDTINGLSMFLDKKPQYKETLRYDIVGSGYKGEETKLNELISKLSLEENIRMHGRKAHFEIQYLFDNCNLGVSYIPKTSYFNHQPPTKTFEYIISGMFCLATSTYENRKYITSQNGILCEDNPKSFSLALENAIDMFNSLDSKEINQTLINYTWSNLAKSLKEFLQNGK